MKILESQNAILTNFEVYQHLVDQDKRYKQSGDSVRRRMPANMKTLVKELLGYLQTFPGPLSQTPLPYDATSIARLVEQLQPYDISKGEMIMILNVRPTNAAVLSACIEDLPVRLTDDQQNELLGIITEVLGQFPLPDGQDDGGAAAGTDKDMMQSIEG